jgi:hypothetical protein
MRDQYAGDISDLIKFAFLRALAGTDRHLGVAWYYVNEHDGRKDGGHIHWRDDAAWEKLDVELYRELSRLPQRSIAALEKLPIWPNNRVFHNEPIPTQARRSSWSETKRQALKSADLVFLDPDNGLGDVAEKHATFEEVRMLRRPGRSIVVIKFPAHTKHDIQVQHLHESLRTESEAASAFTLRTSVMIAHGSGLVPSARWFTVIDPDEALTVRARVFANLLNTIPRVKAQLSES